jgi:hypothetical protein
MLYAIDIDGTIANPEHSLITFHNQDLALRLTTEELNRRALLTLAPRDHDR